MVNAHSIDKTAAAWTQLQQAANTLGNALECGDSLKNIFTDAVAVGSGVSDVWNSTNALSNLVDEEADQAAALVPAKDQAAVKLGRKIGDVGFMVYGVVDFLKHEGLLGEAKSEITSETSGESSSVSSAISEDAKAITPVDKVLSEGRAFTAETSAVRSIERGELPPVNPVSELRSEGTAAAEAASSRVSEPSPVPTVPLAGSEAAPAEALGAPLREGPFRAGQETMLAGDVTLGARTEPTLIGAAEAGASGVTTEAADLAPRGIGTAGAPPSGAEGTGLTAAGGPGEGPKAVQLWRGVYLTDEQAAKMASELEAGIIQTPAMRNGLSADGWRADALDWASRQTGDRAWLVHASDEEKLAAFHVEAARSDADAISFTTERTTAEEWAFKMNKDPNLRPYIIRADITYGDPLVKQTGSSYLGNHEFETTVLGNPEVQSAELYQLTGDPKAILGNGMTYKRVSPNSVPAAPPVPVPGTGEPVKAATVMNEGVGSAGAFAITDTRAPLALAREALALWEGAGAGAGSILERVVLADLPAGELGESFITRLDAAGRPSEGEIVLDRTADGAGWFIDQTPLDASEFSAANSPASGHYDLFSVIAHEVGHTLGFLRGYGG